jgi:hypothetical protein
LPVSHEHLAMDLSINSQDIDCVTHYLYRNDPEDYNEVYNDVFDVVVVVE